MKTFSILIVVFGSLTALGQISKNVTIGKHGYLIKTAKHRLKDDDYIATFYNFFTKKGNEFQAGFIKEAKRNDSLFIVGGFLISGDRLMLKEYYQYYSANHPDSSIRIF